jgi:DNA-binding response OmpR family regulator
VSEILSRVLVADSDIETLNLYRTTFQITGSDVIEAVDGRDALVKAFTRLPSLVVTELRLPFIDGFDLCRVLRRDYQTRSVPILVATGESQLSQLDQAYRAGADLVVTKPFTPDTLLERCQSLVERAAHVQARSAALRVRAIDGLAKAKDLVTRGRERRVARSKSLPRFTTTTPPTQPRQLRCPSCDHDLRYVDSHIGGVNDRQTEQWDTLTCTNGCGTFEYRHRTRRLRRIYTEPRKAI